jgi:integrase
MKNVKAILNKNQVETMAIAMSLKHPRYGLLWEMGILTGLRVSDLLTLKPRQISPDGSFTVTEGKTGKEKTIKLPPKILKKTKLIINRYNLQPGDYIFFSHEKQKHKPVSRQWVHNLIALSAKISGLDSVGTHSMRKTYACNLFLTTGDFSVVQSHMNHRYLSTTLVYLKDLLELKNIKSL